MLTNTNIMQRFMPLKGAEGMKRVENDTTLFLNLEKQNWGFPCNMLARRFLHAAQDGGYGNITVLKGPAHKHEFKVMDLVKKVGTWAGPSLVALKMNKDVWMDDRRKIWVMGSKPNPSAKVISARV